MRTHVSMIALLVLTACAADVGAGNAPGNNARITSIDFGGVDDWHAPSDTELLIKARGGKYYRATMLGICPGLSIVPAIGFVSDPTGALDRFGSVLVERRKCRFSSFEEIAKPERW